jgi:hypothetical protein
VRTKGYQPGRSHYLLRVPTPRALEFGDDDE